jgi:hypothetical protein
MTRMQSASFLIRWTISACINLHRGGVCRRSIDGDWLILGQGITLALVGSGIGITLALGGTRLLKSVFYDVSAADPLTFTAVARLLAGVALLARWLPAHVDGIVALRNE